MDNLFDMLRPDGAPPQGSPTVLDVDLWTIRRGYRLADRWRRIGALEPIRKQLPDVAADALDMMLATEPLPALDPADQERARWWAEMLESPELQTLRTKTMHRPDIAAAAALEIATAYAKRVQDQQNGQGQGKAGDKEGSAAAALAAAGQMADDASEAKTAFGLSAGTEIGQETQVDPELLVTLAKTARGSRHVRDIMAMAGRFIAKASRLKARRTEIPGHELTGIELSGDIARLLPGEAAAVAGVIPELELLALLRVSQRRALSYRKNDHGESRGPIVVSVDESGSMEGERIIAAKALALAMASIARSEGRPFTLCAWSSTAPRVFHSTKNAAADAPHIVNWLKAMQNGGTVLTIPLLTIPNNHWPVRPKKEGADDHIIITDDSGHAEESTLERYAKWSKQTGVRTFGFAVGVSSADGMARYCNGGAWAIPCLTLDSMGVDTVLTI